MDIGTNWASIVISGTLIALGIVGTIIPLIPGLILSWFGVLAYGLMTEWSPVGYAALAVASVLVVVAYAASVRIPVKSTRKEGASKTALLAGTLGGVIGFFVIPIVGLFVGAAAGVFLAELVRLGEGQPAWAATKGVLVGFGISTIVQFAIGLLMAAVWAGWVLTSL